MALRKVLTLRRSRSDRLEGPRPPIQPAFRPDDCVQSHLREMIRFKPGAGLYGALVVKGDISRDHNRVVGRPPATPRGRDRRWSVACRPALSFRDSAADYPANHGIPLADGPRWRLPRPSVPAVEQDAELAPRVKRVAADVAERGAGLAVRLSSSGQRRGGVWTCGIPIVNRDRYVSQDDPRGTRQWARNVASTLLYSGVWSRPDLQPYASTARFRGGGPIL